MGGERWVHQERNCGRNNSTAAAVHACDMFCIISGSATPLSNRDPKSETPCPERMYPLIIGRMVCLGLSSRNVF